MKSKPDKNTSIILASNSRFRAELLKNAGVDFSTASASIDERAIEQPLLEANLEPTDVAQVLAEAKAVDVSARNQNELIIGCDQTLSMNSIMFHKPADMKQARQHILKFSGKTHQLNSAVALVYNQETILATCINSKYDRAKIITGIYWAISGPCGSICIEQCWRVSTGRSRCSAF